nr:hypothetical protein Iba_chr08aCG13050 [Ipomoea batatas]
MRSNCRRADNPSDPIRVRSDDTDTPSATCSSVLPPPPPSLLPSFSPPAFSSSRSAFSFLGGTDLHILLRCFFKINPPIGLHVHFPPPVQLDSFCVSTSSPDQVRFDNLTFGSCSLSSESSGYIFHVAICNRLIQNEVRDRLEEQSSESDRRAVGSCSSMGITDLWNRTSFSFVLLFFIVSVCLLPFHLRSAFLLCGEDQAYFFVRFGLHSSPGSFTGSFPDHRHLSSRRDIHALNTFSYQKNEFRDGKRLKFG